MISTDIIQHNFKYHAPDATKVEVHEAIRKEFGELALKIDRMLVESREKSLVLTKLEEGMMWANAGIARY